MEVKEFAEFVDKYFKDTCGEHGGRSLERERIIRYDELPKDPSKATVVLEVGLKYLKKARSWGDLADKHGLIITNSMYYIPNSRKFITTLLRGNKGYIKVMLNLIKKFNWPPKPKEGSSVVSAYMYLVSVRREVEGYEEVPIQKGHLFWKKTVMEKRKKSKQTFKSREEIIKEISKFL